MSNVPDPSAAEQPPAAPSSIDPDGALRLLDVDRAPPGTFGELEPASPPLTDAQGRIRLSFSRIDSYRNCPRKFRYAYVDRLPGVPGPHLSFGTSIHGALEAFYDRKLPSCPTVEELLGMDRDDVIDMLGVDISPMRVKCAVLAEKVAQDGAEIYRGELDKEKTTTED